MDDLAKRRALGVEPGEYPAEWSLDGETFPGDCDLQPGSLPLATIHGSLALDGDRRSYPRYRTEPLIVGRLRTGLDVELRNCHVTTMIGAFDAEQNWIGAYWAIVGARVSEVPDRKYSSLRLQLTGLDEFIRTNPVLSYEWPRNWTDSEEEPPTAERVSGVINPDRSQEWTIDGVTMRCGYEHGMSLSGYELAVTFAPVVTIESELPLDLDDWIAAWVRPLQRLVTFATGRPQDLAWITVHREVPDSRSPRGRTTITGQVFGPSITQTPYTARRPDPEMDRRASRLSLSTLPAPLPTIVRRWHELDGDGSDPFVELFRLVLFTPDLPQRARFLYLAQALEALHATANADEDEARAVLHAARRVEAIDAVQSGELEKPLKRFIKRNLSPRPLVSLEARLSALIDNVGDSLDPVIAGLEASDVARSLGTRGATAFPAMVRVLRNDLSHGSHNYAAPELESWTDALMAIAEHHLAQQLSEIQ